MDFRFTEEQEMLRNKVRDVAEENKLYGQILPLGEYGCFSNWPGWLPDMLADKFTDPVNCLLSL